jgi:hypothetical protein
MLLNKLLSVGLLLTSLSFCFISSANDSSIGDDNGTIKFKNQPDISMDKESLFISEDKILVDYAFTNTSRQDLVTSIAFPMPPMYFGGSDHTGIQNFRLWVDGKPVKTKRKLIVLLNNKQDISEKVRQLGWSENDLISMLQSNKLPDGKKPLPTDWFDKYEQPRFTLNEYFIWQQIFAANKPVSIRHSYSPSVTTGVPRSANNIIEQYAKDSCLDKNDQNDVRERTNEYGVGWAYLRYILVTANNWRGPIKDFHLTIKKRKASDLVSLCFDEKLKKVDSLTFEFRKRNFQPKRDLNLLVIRGKRTN